MWTDKQFWAQANECWRQYRTQYGWGFSDQAQIKDYQGDQEILAGLKMYLAVSQGQLMLVLGDAKIRQDETLVMNFGVASGSGPEDQKMIDKLNEQRWDHLVRNTGAPAIPVSGSGSILSDKKWTPLVNDSYILGGTHRAGEFDLALEDFDQFKQELQARRQVFDDQQKWRAYLREKPEILWNSQVNCPRVFARELIGLKTFGYVPEFTSEQLGFRPGSGAAQADFRQYLTALDQAGFPAKDKARVLSSVSTFLFGDAKALN